MRARDKRAARALKRQRQQFETLPIGEATEVDSWPPDVATPFWFGDEDEARRASLPNERRETRQ